MPSRRRRDEAHRQQHEIGLEREFGCRESACILSSTRTQSSAVTAPFSPRKLASSDGEVALRAFLVRGRGAQLQRPVGPGQQLVLGLRAASAGSRAASPSAPWRIEVPMQSEPVSPPPITTTCLPVARIGSLVPTGSPRHAAVLLRQEVHGEMDAGEFAAGDRQVARRLGAAGEHDRVVVVDQRGGGDVAADMRRWNGRRRPRPPSARCGGRSACFSSLKSGMP